MSSAAVLLITKDVAGLEDIPAGPERAAACNRPRRQCWDVLATVQRSLNPLPVAAAHLDGWQRDQAQEAVDCCQDLRDVMAVLQGHDRASGDSHWALTEYSALLDEVERLRSLANRILGKEGEIDVDELTPIGGNKSDPTEKAIPVKSMSKFTLTTEAESPRSMASSPNSSPRGGSDISGSLAQDAAVEATPPIRIARKPIRLRVEDLHEEYPHCEWATNGTCDYGCTVGGCHFKVEAEAW